MANETVEEEIARAARAAARHVRMSHEHASAGADGDSPEQRIELMFELTRAAWAMSGLPLVQLPRAQWPVRIRKLGEPA